MPVVKITYDMGQSVKAIDKTDKAIKGLDDSTDKLRKETDKYSKEVKKAGDNGSKSFLNIKNAIGLISIAAIISQTKEFIKEVTKITAEFQRFEAVLSNTLGSNSRAQIAMQQIVDFASKTPFQVNQLTGAFVKLANQGFTPTTKELRKLGDLASSTGKDFDQLAEAIIDAQVGEFERLKEFGIRASKQGDQVKFTFKGVETQVKFTEDAIRSYILALGDAEGVTGAMEKISKTLGGQLSNLQDKWDQLLVTIGKASGDAYTPLSLFGDVLERLTNALKDQSTLDLERTAKHYRELSQSIEGITDQSKLQQKLSLITAELEANSNAVNQAEEDYVFFTNAIKGSEDEEGFINKKYFDRLKEAQTRQEALKLVYEDIKKSLDGINDANKKRLEMMEKAIALSNQAGNAVKGAIDEMMRLQQFDESEAFRKWGNSVKEDLLPELQDIGKVIDESINEGNSAIDRIVDKEQEAADLTYDIWKKSYDERKELEQEFRNASFMILETFLGSVVQAEQVDFEGLRERKEQELELAGDNADARKAIEKNFRKEEEKLREEQAKKEKEANLKRILIETALGIMKAVAAAPPPINIPLIAIQAALGAAQYAAASSVPAFKDGVIDLKGAGTETSDSIPARLSRGESVITAKSTRNSKELLNDIQAGKMDDKTYKFIMGNNRPAQPGVTFSDDRIVNELKKNRPSDFVRQGSTLYEVKEIGKNTKQKIRRRVL